MHSLATSGAAFRSVGSSALCPRPHASGLLPLALCPVRACHSVLSLLVCVADDKKPWEEKAKADKERFDEETKSYKASGGGEGSKKGKKDKMSVDDFEKVGPLACLVSHMQRY
jgi:hypothetical protein